MARNKQTNKSSKKTSTKILIIEDEKELADLLASKLKKEGYKVEIADDGKKGYEKLGKWKPDLVLLDIVMPKMDGYEVMEKMNENKKNIPIIVISNSGHPVELEKTKKLGAIDHLIKTEFSPNDVLKKVNNYITGKSGKGKESAQKKKKAESKENDGVEKKGVNVLLVEDESFLRKLCTKQLTKDGYSVFEAKDGEEALNLFNDNRIDMVLLDIILPSMDGFQVLKKIRSNKNKKKSQIPIVMLSNLGQDSDIKKAKDIGADDFMIKANFTTKEIIEKVASFVKE